MKSKENKKTLKHRILNWLENSRIHRWWFNRKNGIVLLSEKEWMKIIETGKITKNIIIEEI